MADYITSLPAVGDGITEPQWTDSHAYTVVAVTAKGFTAQADNASRIHNPADTFVAGGFVGHWTEPQGQQWTYEPETSAQLVRFTQRKNGTFGRAGGKPVIAGRHQYYDRNF